ncbi:MAG: VanZ family protein [Planctomycetes bacterium]|nr:VanZ family protein [Planctomycetota bacterium]
MRALRPLLSRRRCWTVLAIAWMATLFWSSHRQWEGVGSGIPGLGNFLHAPFYALLSGLWALGLGAIGASAAADRGAAPWQATLIATVFGALDEWHQSFVPGRTASLWDVATDLFGAAAAAATIRAYQAGELTDRRRWAAILGLVALALTCALGP